MDLKKAYQEKVEAQLTEWGKYLEVIKAKAKTKMADAKVSIGEHMDSLHQNYEAFKAKWAESKTAQADKWEGIKAGLEQKFEELKAAFQKHKSENDSAHSSGKPEEKHS